MKLNYTILKEDEQRTVYELLKKKFKVSRRLIISLKKDSKILINGAPVFTNHRATEGDILSVDLTESENSGSIVPEDIPLKIIYEDEHILAVNKPKGMAVHPTLNYENGTLANAIMNYYKNECFVFRSVNRLDKDTSGIVLIAKNKLSAERLSKQLSEKQVEKIYIAIVCNSPSPEQGKIIAPISREDRSIIKRKISDNGAYSETHYKLLKESTDLSLVAVSPITGRTHQIRIHMAHIGCPLYADFLYGKEIENETFYLHCYSLKFRHPLTEEKIELICEAPEYFIIK